jgi:hypothetical protein
MSAFGTKRTLPEHSTDVRFWAAPGPNPGAISFRLGIFFVKCPRRRPCLFAGSALIDDLFAAHHLPVAVHADYTILTHSNRSIASASPLAGNRISFVRAAMGKRIGRLKPPALCKAKQLISWRLGCVRMT